MPDKERTAAPAISQLFSKLTNATTLEEALKEKGADFTAVMKPNYQRLELADPRTVDPTNEGYHEVGGGIVYLEIPDRAIVVRGDDHSVVLGNCSDRYGLVQYREMLAFLNDMVGENMATFHSLNLVDNGARIHIVMKAPDYIELAPGERVDCYFVASCSHDSSLPLQGRCIPIHEYSGIAFTTMGRRGAVTIKHSAKVEDRLEEARAWNRQIHSFWQKWAQDAQRLSKLKITDSQAELYFLMVRDGESPQAQNARAKMMDLYKRGPCSGQISCRDTLLGCLLAACLEAELYKTTKRSIRGKEELDCMFESRLHGTGAKQKAKAYSCGLVLEDRLGKGTLLGDQ